MGIELTLRRLLKVNQYLKVTQNTVEHTDESLRLFQSYATSDPVFAMLGEFLDAIPSFALVGYKAVESWYQVLFNNNQSKFTTISQIKLQAKTLNTADNWRFDGLI